MSGTVLDTMRKLVAKYPQLLACYFIVIIHGHCHSSESSEIINGGDEIDVTFLFLVRVLEWLFDRETLCKLNVKYVFEIS